MYQHPVHGVVHGSCWISAIVRCSKNLLDKSIVRTRVESTADKIRWIENTDWHARKVHADPNRWFMNGETGANAVAYRHLDGCNVLYFDGHIEYKNPE